MKSALVTGGAGFIGCHLVKELIDNGWFVTVVDDLSAGNLENLTDKVKIRATLPSLFHAFNLAQKLPQEQVLVITGDFSDPAILCQIRENRFSHIFHLAANPRVEFSVKHPDITSMTNIQKTVQLITACKDSKIEKFVFASSSAVYGNPKELPTNENAEKSPTSPYGLQKLVIERYLQMFSDLYNMKSVALRFANVYGPNSDGNSPYSTAIGSWCDKLTKNFPLRSDGDGEQSRDMVFVKDISSALRHCAEIFTNADFDVFNVGTKASVTNNQILDKLVSFGQTFQIDHAPTRPGDVKHTLLDNTKLVNTNWLPKYTIDSGLKETLIWWELL